ncbi:hypothetical protein EDC14_100319 [Hydrogenispora ethanolica]|jgi:drug/metabolite transporter (DMT)-like permease|uniref:EamA-like transporter family protein n=1 Tax=Hydrogenispora ethanolica TaxID=1082276 RepID=A0A4R1S778_HYDET|nr:hypothetical protein [Hydrogenispora ethanolica]TCL75089.1 hypothetical protein EDC14_100319 [Hydrogenispora ethanolica]
MWLYYFAIFLVVISNVFYHISQKSTPVAAHPILSLTVTYLTAAAFTLILLPFFPLQEGLAASLKKLNWTCLSLGIAIVGLELGFLLAYRAGWNISVAQFFSTVIITLVLIPVGLLFFQEKMTLINGLGILLCLGGFMLINIK